MLVYECNTSWQHAIMFTCTLASNEFRVSPSIPASVADNCEINLSYIFNKYTWHQSIRATMVPVTYGEFKSPNINKYPPYYISCLSVQPVLLTVCEFLSKQPNVAWMLTCIVMVSIANWEIGLSLGLVGSVYFLCYWSCAKINSRVWLHSISDCMHSVVHLLVIYQKVPVICTCLISHRKI